ncbi:hypothetical protein [Clostridium tagluense]|uniref:hypothetical protein n=1 Tax=Clostridium tagluense TaxID=360422 RepID=UPI001CF1AAA3|nr:hypothetical protein [Clostridium tagluense]MCB2300641.1 hypothetical protein [Clostridium tagluense]
MEEEIKVNPTPIQRNINDVAMELTQLYYRSQNSNSIEKIQEVYRKFYATAKIVAGIPYSDLKDS